MDVQTLVGGLVAIIGLVAGVVQILDYLQKRQEKKRQPLAEGVLAPSSPVVPAVPNNLPSRGGFIGRGKDKARVREALASRWPLTCIDGIGGIGKTALALEVAGECLQASKGEIPADGIPPFDGFIWTTARDRELALNDVLDVIARTLGYRDIAQQPLKEKRESVRRLLQSKRHLLIVDNFDTVTDEALRDFLLRLPEPSKALITSREQMLCQAWAVSLKGLEQEEALTLIRSEGRRLGLASVERGEKQVLLRLWKATGGAPLAIKWAAGQVKQKGQSLDTVLTALHEARGDIFKEVFAHSWSLLSDEARRILVIMPIFAASASKAAIEAVSDVHHFALDEGLGQLVEMWLVEAADELDATKRRYSIHPLTRAFAGANLRKDEKWEREARLRAAQYLLEYAQRYGGYANWAGYDRLEAELANLLGIFDWCYEAGELRFVVDFLEATSVFLDHRGHWYERISRGGKAMEAAEKLGDHRASAWIAIYHVGWMLLLQGDYEAAMAVIDQGKRIAEERAYLEGLAAALRNLGVIALEEGRYEDARRLCEEGLKIWIEVGNERWVAITRGTLGNIAQEQEYYDEAYHQYDEQRKAYAELGDRNGLSVALANLMKVAHRQGRGDEAEYFYNEALRVFHEIGRQDGEQYLRQLLDSRRRGGYPQMRRRLLEARDSFRRH